jgi:nicotinate-nucleotide--dimethylbenzimidazole phosphoribosyltransferase
VADSSWSPPAIAPLDGEAMAAALVRWASRAKPPGSLGRLEELAVQLAGITGRCPPAPIERPAVVVFAADHGVVDEGASAWPRQVTALMVRTMAEGRAAINAFARTVGAEVHLVDVGVDADLRDLAALAHHKVRLGTGNIATGPAMTRAEAVAALQVGIAVAHGLVEGGVDCVCGGDMGIGNTTPSAALVAALTASSADAVTGPGAGLAPDRLPHKRALVAKALSRARALTDPMDVLVQVGGLEIAALAGLFVGATARRVPVVLDGVVAAAALCVAAGIAPGCAARCVAGHRSTEPAATIALAHLGLEPLLDLGLHLGEGTGACLAIPLLRASIAALTDMADLPST